MNILIRVDASTEIGTGHVMRCLTLADLLREEGAQVYFVCRELEGNLCSYISEKGYQCLRLLDGKQMFDQEEDALETIQLIKTLASDLDLVIVDHYQIDYRWERMLRSAVPKIMVIDDLADRTHDCNLLLDQNYYEDYEKRYDELVPANCVKLLGPQFLLLRPEFYEAMSQSIERDGTVKRILVFFGGSDPTNETEKCLLALEELIFSNDHKDFNVETKVKDEVSESASDIGRCHIDVVVGTANQNRQRIQELCQQLNLQYHCQIDYLAELMAKADLSIGAGGVTMWERMVMGLPSLTVIVAENQRVTVEAASKYGAIWNLGWHENVKVEDYVDTIKEVLTRVEMLREMSRKGKRLVGEQVSILKSMGIGR